MALLEAGTLVANKYRVRRRLGAGGMGAVYEGEHVEIGKRVAIKVIEHEHARSAELAARFKREARAASAVESEHIVQVFDVGEDPAVGLYMVMEYLAGEDLAERLARAGGRLPVEEAAPIVIQAARALAKAHAAGVVHRDLKPANLFLTTREDGSPCVKILDFGISKLARPETSAGNSLLTREGSVMGTPLYMSPEQAQGLAVDGRTDIWSLGAVLYEALSGRTVFDPRDNYEQMIVQIVTKRPKPLREVAPWVPTGIAGVVDAALAHDVAARTPDATTFARRLVEAGQRDSMPEALAPTMLVDSSRTPALPVTQNPTDVGVVVATRAGGGKSAQRSRAIQLAAVAIVVFGAAFVTITSVLGKRSSETRAPAVGLVVPPPPVESGAAPAALPAGSTAPALPALAGEPAASASAAPAAATQAQAPAKTPPPPRGAPRAPAAAPPARGGGSQYGAAGVTTAY